MLDGGGHARGSGGPQGPHSAPHHCRRPWTPRPSSRPPRTAHPTDEPTTCGPRCGAGPPRPAVAGTGDRPLLGPTRPARPPRRHRGPALLGAHRQRLVQRVLLRGGPGRAARAGRPSSSAPPTPASSITVDKPPASLWVMALSVRALGLSSFSILMPEVLMGVASVGGPVRHRQAPVRRSRRAARRRGARADPGRGDDVPVQQPRRAARAADDPRRLGHAARRRAGQPEVADLGRCLHRLRLPHQDAAGARGRPGVRPGLPRRGADAAAQAHRAPARGRCRDGRCRPAGGSPSSSSSPPRPAPTSADRRATRSSSSPWATTGSAGSPATRSGPSAVAVEPPPRPAACGAPRG